MTQDLLTAFALLLIIEGLLPTLAPEFWRRMLKDISGVSQRAIRIGGVVALVAGALLFQAVH